jgi:hypothetical protein
VSALEEYRKALAQATSESDDHVLVHLADAAIAELEAEVADLKLSLELVALEKREARAEVKRLRADGCGGDPYCDCYVPPARVEELEDECVPKSWGGLLTILNDIYPEAVFDGSSGDIGSQLVVLARKLEQAEARCRAYEDAVSGERPNLKQANTRLVSDNLYLREELDNAEAEVALRDRMLEREYDDPTPKTAGYMRWFADLRARAEEAK